MNLQLVHRLWEASLDIQHVHHTSHTPIANGNQETGMQAVHNPIGTEWLVGTESLPLSELVYKD